MTFPSARVVQLFRDKIPILVAGEGEPAALGKSATGPVYYTGGATEHKNRVWFRKGANKEVIGIARADNMGIPDVPDLPIEIAERFGIYWVVNWQRENAAVAVDELVKVSANDTTANYLLSKLAAGSNITLTETNDGGDETVTIAASGGATIPPMKPYDFAAWDAGTGVTLVGAVGATEVPAWEFANGTTSGIRGLARAPAAGSSLRITLIWSTAAAAGTGVRWSWNTASIGDGELLDPAAETGLGRTDTVIAAEALHILTFPTRTHSPYTDVSAGDWIPLFINRDAAHADDNTAAAVHLLAAMVEVL